MNRMSKGTIVRVAVLLGGGICPRRPLSGWCLSWMGNVLGGSCPGGSCLGGCFPDILTRLQCFEKGEKLRLQWGYFPSTKGATCVCYGVIVTRFKRFLKCSLCLPRTSSSLLGKSPFWSLLGLSERDLLPGTRCTICQNTLLACQ